MTLDIKAWLTDMINREQKISHNGVPFCVCKASKIPSNIKTKINDQYGESYINDAQYVIFFKKPNGFSKDDTKKVFNIVNKSLGKAANNSTISDYKKLDEDEETDSKLDSQPDDTDVEDPSDDSSDETSVDSTPTNPTMMFVKITLK